MEQEDLVVTILITILILVGGYFLIPSSTTTTQHTQLAKCLAANNATMYGYDACPHCRRQKRLIGKQAFTQHIDNNGLYVRCRPRQLANQPLGQQRAQRITTIKPVNASTTQLQACRINVKRGTPTWVINGKQYTGVQSTDALAQAAQCPQ